MFKISDGRDYFYQWDTGIVLNLTGTYADTINEVHFCHKYSRQPLTVAVKHDGEVPTVAVPNILLQSTRSIIVYAFCRSEMEKYTRLDEVIRVEARPKPANYVYEETEILDYKELSEQFLAELEKVNVKTSMLSRQKVSLPKDGAGNVVNGTKGQVATSDGNGGVTWQDGVAKPDWNQSDENAADFIKNRPFYDNTITYLSWDGSTEGLISVDAGDLSLHKVCDYISKDDLLKSTAVIIEDSNAFEYNITQRDITDIGDNCYVAMNFIYVIAADNYSVDGLTFPKAGVYTLTPDATGGSYVAKIYKRDLKQIDVKYIPTTVNGKNADETGAITLNNKDVGATKLIVVTYDGSTNVATMSSKEIQAEHNAGNVIVFSANDGKDLYNLIECTNDGLYARFSSVKQSEDLHTPYVKFVKIDYAKSITYESIDLMPLPVDTEGNTIKHTEGQVYGYTDGRYNWITPVTSWNQLEDKPFGEESVKESTIPSTYVKVTQAVQSVSGVKTFDIINGDTYEVYISNNVYTCVAANGCIGDSLPFFQDRIPEGYEGLPFYIRGGSAQYVYVYGLDIGYVYTLSVNHVYTKIDQLDEKYIPSYGSVFTINAIRSQYDASTNSYTVTPDKTYSEAWEAVKAGKDVQVVLSPDNDPNDITHYTLVAMHGAQSAYFVCIDYWHSKTLCALIWSKSSTSENMTLYPDGELVTRELMNDFLDALANKVNNLSTLPAVTASDNSKILQVVDGEWTTTDNICYEKSETLLAWDGNTTGLESVTSEDESVTVYRVSDFIPLANIMGATINVNTGGVTNSAVISDTFITELSDNASYACVGVLISVATAGIEIDGITFSTPGTYCISPSLAEGAYISSIVKSEIKRIDEKFIPDIAPVKLNEITSVSYSKPQTVLLEKNHIYKIVLKASVAVSDHEYTARITFTAPNGTFDKEYTLMSGGSSAKNSIGFNVVIGDDYVLVDDELHTFSGSSKDNLPAITFAQTNSSVTASQDYYKPYVIKLS